MMVANSLLPASSERSPSHWCAGDPPHEVTPELSDKKPANHWPFTRATSPNLYTLEQDPEY